MSVYVLCVLVLLFIAVDVWAVTTYRKLIRLLRHSVYTDWGLLADGHTGIGLEFERLWLRTMQQAYKEIHKDKEIAS